MLYLKIRLFGTKVRKIALTTTLYDIALGCWLLAGVTAACREGSELSELSEWIGAIGVLVPLEPLVALVELVSLANG